MQHLKKIETTFGIIPSAKSTGLTASSGTVSGNACSSTGTAGSAANIFIVDHFTNLALPTLPAVDVGLSTFLTILNISNTTHCHVN